MMTLASSKKIPFFEIYFTGILFFLEREQNHSIIKS